jgi:hypothetical protein
MIVRQRGSAAHLHQKHIGYYSRNKCSVMVFPNTQCVFDGDEIVSITIVRSEENHKKTNANDEFALAA